MTEILEILEDQIFLLNQIRILKSDAETVYDYLMKNDASLSNIFLSFQEIIRCKNVIKDHILKLFGNTQVDTEWNINVSIFIRGLCNCLILIREIHSNPEEEIFRNSFLAMTDIDKYVTNLSVHWTTKSTVDIISDLQTLLNFVYVFGSLHCLPIGFGIEDIKCFQCRKSKAISTGKRETLVNTCTHIHVESPCKFDAKPYGNEARNLSVFETEKQHALQTSKSASSALGYKIQLYQIEQEIKNTKDIMQNIIERYNNLELEKQHLVSLKCISPYLYQILGFYICMTIKRLDCVSLFLRNYNLNLTDTRSSKERLENILKEITFSKLNKMLVREEFSKIYLCPMSIYDENSTILRTSIVLKKHLLASGMSEENVDAIDNNMISVSLKNLLTRGKKTLQDEIYYVLLVFILYNTWLSMQRVNEYFHLNWSRPESYKDENVVFLYEGSKLGVLLEDQKMLFTYEQAFEICIHHLDYIKRKGICNHSLQIQDVLGPYTNHPF